MISNVSSNVLNFCNFQQWISGTLVPNQKRLHYKQFFCVHLAALSTPSFSPLHHSCSFWSFLICFEMSSKSRVKRRKRGCQTGTSEDAGVGGENGLHGWRGPPGRELREVAGLPRRESSVPRHQSLGRSSDGHRVRAGRSRRRRAQRAQRRPDCGAAAERLLRLLLARSRVPGAAARYLLASNTPNASSSSSSSSSAVCSTCVKLCK